LKYMGRERERERERMDTRGAHPLDASCRSLMFSLSVMALSGARQTERQRDRQEGELSVSSPRVCDELADSRRFHVSGITAYTDCEIPTSVAATRIHVISCSANGPPAASTTITIAAAALSPIGRTRFNAFGIPS